MGTKHSWTNSDGLRRYGGPRTPEGNNQSAEKAIDKEITLSAPVSGAGRNKKILGTRTGQNGGIGSLAAGIHCNGLMKHHLPNGAKSLQIAYSGVTATGAAGEYPNPPTALYVKSAAVASGGGGSGYVVGELVPLAAGGTGQVAPVLRVLAVNAGAITRVAVHEPGSYDSAPSDPVLASGATSIITGTTVTAGAGTGASFVLTLEGAATLANIAIQPDSEDQTVTQRLYFGTTPTGMARNYVNVPSGNLALSSPSSFDLPKGRRIGTRFFFQGGTLGRGRHIGVGERFGGLVSTSVDTSGDASAGTLLTAGNYFDGYQPTAIYGTPQDGSFTGSWVIFGTSIENSQAGSPSVYDTPDADGNIAWVEKAIASTMGFINLSIPGGKIATLMQSPNSSVLTIGMLRALYNDGVAFDAALVGAPVNDFNSTATFADIVTYTKALWALLRGLGFRRILASTCTPYTSGTYADLAGQTPVEGANGVTTKIQAWNAALRGGQFAGLIDDFIDHGTVVESSIGSGKWVPGSTTDGLHPATAAHDLMAANARAKMAHWGAA